MAVGMLYSGLWILFTSHWHRVSSQLSGGLDRFSWTWGGVSSSGWPRVKFLLRMNNDLGSGSSITLRKTVSPVLTCITVFQPCLNMLGTVLCLQSFVGYSDNYWHTLRPAALLSTSSLFSVLVLALSLTGWCHQSCQCWDNLTVFVCWQNRIKVLFSYRFQFSMSHTLEIFTHFSILVFVSNSLSNQISWYRSAISATRLRLVDFFTTNLRASS